MRLLDLLLQRREKKGGLFDRLQEPLMGLEPTTCSLRMSRSTN